MNVVISVGGSVLSPGDPERVAAHAAVVEALHDAGHEVSVVVGGGSTALEYIEVARELGANEMKLDDIGIAATRLNARLLIEAIGDAAVQTPPETYDEASEALRRGDVAVMGGVAPAQTTDAVSAALAEYVDADLLVYGTSVSGVYTADPNEDPDAEHIPEISAADLVERIAGIEMNAGAAAPVDLLAAKVIQRSGLRTIVLDGTDPERIQRAVETGEHEGTDVLPANGGADPDGWSASAATDADGDE